MTILLCVPAAPKRTSRGLSFRKFACAVAYCATAGLGIHSPASNPPTKNHWSDSPNENMGLLTYGTYDAWALCRQMKLLITFLNGTSDAKIKSLFRVTYINYLPWNLWRSEKNNARKYHTLNDLSCYFSTNFVFFSTFCWELLSRKCMLCDVYGHLLSFDGHDFFESISYKTVFGNYVVFFLFLGPLTQHPYEFWDLWPSTLPCASAW